MVFDRTVRNVCRELSVSQAHRRRASPAQPCSPLASAPSISARLVSCVCSPQAWNGPAGAQAATLGAAHEYAALDPRIVVPGREDGVVRREREVGTQSLEGFEPGARAVCDPKPGESGGRAGERVDDGLHAVAPRSRSSSSTARAPRGRRWAERRGQRHEQLRGVAVLDSGVGGAEGSGSGGSNVDPADHARGNGEHDAVDGDLGACPHGRRARPSPQVTRSTGDERCTIEPSSGGEREGDALVASGNARADVIGMGGEAGELRSPRRGRRSRRSRPRVATGSPRSRRGRAAGVSSSIGGGRSWRDRGERCADQRHRVVHGAGGDADPAARLAIAVEHALRPQTRARSDRRRTRIVSFPGRMNSAPISTTAPFSSSRDQTLPPTRSRASNTITSTPAATSASAAASPANPAPTIATRTARLQLLRSARSNACRSASVSGRERPVSRSRATSTASASAARSPSRVLDLLAQRDARGADPLDGARDDDAAVVLRQLAPDSRSRRVRARSPRRRRCRSSRLVDELVTALLEIGGVDGVVDVPVGIDVTPADFDLLLVHGPRIVPRLTSRSGPSFNQRLHGSPEGPQGHQPPWPAQGCGGRGARDRRARRARRVREHDHAHSAPARATASSNLVVPKPTGPGGLPLPRPDNAVTWAITSDNEPIPDGVPNESGPLDDLQLRRLPRSRASSRRSRS